MKRQLLAQGAEAKIYKEGSTIVKERIKKNYRLSEIDRKLRKERTQMESKMLTMAKRAGVLVPRVLDENNKDMTLTLELLDGPKVRDWLESTQKFEQVMEKIGAMTAKLHNENITHGDLTTSNLILKDEEPYIIDLGLAKYTKRTEDKAVDLHLMKECLKSKHHRKWLNAWNAFIKGYQSKSKDPEEILTRLKTVEARGRYKKGS